MEAETEVPTVIECDGCSGWGIVKGPIDESTGKRTVVEHERCNGAGILILVRVIAGEHPYRVYRAPKLR